ncbi:hypothetical protein ACJX0J_024998, partial [Zea mays]
PLFTLPFCLIYDRKTKNLNIIACTPTYISNITNSSKSLGFYIYLGFIMELYLPRIIINKFSIACFMREKMFKIMLIDDIMEVTDQVIFVDADQIISENEEALWFRLMSLFCLHFPTGLEKKHYLCYNIVGLELILTKNYLSNKGYDDGANYMDAAGGACPSTPTVDFNILSIGIHES